MIRLAGRDSKLGYATISTEPTLQSRVAKFVVSQHVGICSIIEMDNNAA